uniref:JmjC domain-containing protein n=1 Tax=Haptolina ericina TaxID=156174 RepID=A0A7S3ANI3_9EUKA|mmetsp:Transcript_24846/g.56640  ORF Transcript_24846/g.56640 Transcript_24846/m.56640 type:complete len:413 (+) Transcript_24846:322-1560(+)
MAQSATSQTSGRFSLATPSRSRRRLRKRWLVERPRAAGAWVLPEHDSRQATVDYVRAVEANARFTTWDDQGTHLWQCVQGPGEVVVVPSGLWHAVLNYGEVLALSVQHDRPFETALLAATYMGHEAAVTELLNDGGADASAGLSGGAGGSSELEVGDIQLRERPLYVAASCGHVRVVRLLLAHGALVTARNWYGQQPLHAAASSADAGADECLALLLEGGAPADAADDRGETPLLLAVQSGRAASVRRLIEAGASLHAADSESGSQALHHAAVSALHETAQLCIDAGDAAMVELLLKAQALRWGWLVSMGSTSPRYRPLRLSSGNSCRLVRRLMPSPTTARPHCTSPPPSLVPEPTTFQRFGCWLRHSAPMGDCATGTGTAPHRSQSSMGMWRRGGTCAASLGCDHTVGFCQ